MTIGRAQREASVPYQRCILYLAAARDLFPARRDRRERVFQWRKELAQAAPLADEAQSAARTVEDKGRQKPLHTLDMHWRGSGKPIVATCVQIRRAGWSWHKAATAGAS